MVLTNLTNIYIMQKKRELVVMRINGFTVKEVIGYCTRETIVTTIAGIVLGIALGSDIAYRIVRSMEQAFIRFDRGVSPLAWLYGALITVLLAASTYPFMTQLGHALLVRLQEVTDSVRIGKPRGALPAPACPLPLTSRTPASVNA